MGGGGANRGPSRARATDAPRPVLGVVDAVALIVGIVVGAGIFRAPSAVASNAPSLAATLGAWLLGGAISLAGAMCYAELATAYPHAGGDYHFLHRALGRGPAFLFGWARLTVIPTGSVAMLGFVFGDYAAELLRRPAASAALAAVMVCGVTAVNVAGLSLARRTQLALAAALVAALLVVGATGLLVPAAWGPAPPAPPRPAFGLAMVFVLLAYGGWNEAAYVSAELRGGRRAIATALVLSISLLTALYLLANVAYLRGLGLGGVQRSSAVAAELLSRGLGPVGGSVVAAVVAAAAFSAANATMLMGSRMIWAFGLDLDLKGTLGRWSGRAGSPVNAILLQGAIALALVGLGALSRSGFEAMVAYVAPVFWLFFLATGVSLFVLRRRDGAAPRPFRVPLYPATPLLFCAACAYLLWSSLVHAGPGALLGLAVLATGLVPLWLTTRSAASRRPATA
jgi:APA family basic amino acid/polyamine antiporter